MKILADSDPVRNDGVGPLLQAAGVGDREAFEALYRATSPRLFGVCLRLLHDRSEAEDVLQDVYVAVWRNAGQYDPSRASGMTWLGMVARNKAIDRLRTLPPQQSRQTLDVTESAPDPSASPLDDAAAAGDRARLDECLEHLDARRRGLIRMAFFDGATYEELAARIGSPLGTVKSWIRRGLAQLRACLDT